MLPDVLKESFKTFLENQTGNPVIIKALDSLPGGSINNALRVDTENGKWFVKWNYTRAYPGMFEAEQKGMEILKRAGEVFVPEVTGTFSTDKYSMLILEYVEPGLKKSSFWDDFGTNLAKLHNHSGDHFGLDHNNYIGSLPQYNDFSNNWINFFINQRLEIQIKTARDKGLIEKAMMKKFEKMYPFLPDFFPEEKPSLLHGDLWSGNYMTNHEGDACIIDPAVYYGHRLMDLGMSRLFGGFDEAFYQSYQHIYPLESNWIKATDIANLYPLMVHVNLFGGGYSSAVNRILSDFF